jgi:hypothetical protein
MHFFFLGYSTHNIINGRAANMKTFATFLATTIMSVALASGPTIAQQKLALKASDVHPAG